MYIQSENKEPFYVIINNKNFSSSLSGYLVIPRLKNGKYFFIAGFPKNKYPEQKFSYVINDKDVGFVFKQFGKEGWGLFNIIDFTKIMANAQDWETDKMQNDTTTIDDTYSISPIIKTTEKTSITSKEEPTKKTETVATNNEKENKVTTNQQKETATEKKEKEEKEEIETTATSTTSTTSTSKTTITTSPQQDDKKTTSTKTEVVNNNKKGIIRSYQKNGVNGLDEMYIDYTITPFDTIIVFIPLQTEYIATSYKTNTTEETNNTNNKNEYNTACVNLATESDVLRIRKLMSSESTDESMIQIAKKSFANKCFYVEQIQKLGLLFLSEQNRLKFFTTAYPFIYDKFNYPSLEMQFTLSSVINQFRQSL